MTTHKLSLPDQVCEVHGRPLLVLAWCPACRGQKGGKVKNDKKALASRLNGRKHVKPKPP